MYSIENYKDYTVYALNIGLLISNQKRLEKNHQIEIELLVLQVSIFHSLSINKFTIDSTK